VWIVTARSELASELQRYLRVPESVEHYVNTLCYPTPAKSQSYKRGGACNIQLAQTLGRRPIERSPISSSKFQMVTSLRIMQADRLGRGPSRTVSLLPFHFDPDSFSVNRLQFPYIIARKLPQVPNWLNKNTHKPRLFHTEGMSFCCALGSPQAQDLLRRYLSHA